MGIMKYIQASERINNPYYIFLWNIDFNIKEKNAMKQTVYLLKNESGSDGEYLINDEYETLAPHSQIVLNQKPVNCTANIKLVVVRKEVKE